jgi:phage shock protein A
MGLFKKISDIISANLGEMAESFEDPEKMLNQAVREMGESIREATQETAKTLASEKRLVKELAHNESEMKQWQSRAEQAVESGDDDLARKALTRKQEHEKLVIAIRSQHKAATEASQTLRQQLDAMKAKLAEAKRNLATLTARQKAADVRKKLYTASTEPGEIGLDDRAFDKFDRMRDKVEQAEAEAEALAELQGFDTGSSSSGFDDLDSGSDIEAELEKLKQSKKK